MRQSDALGFAVEKYFDRVAVFDGDDIGCLGDGLIQQPQGKDEMSEEELHYYFIK